MSVEFSTGAKGTGPPPGVIGESDVPVEFTVFSEPMSKAGSGGCLGKSGAAAVDPNRVLKLDDIAWATVRRLMKRFQSSQKLPM